MGFVKRTGNNEAIAFTCPNSSLGRLPDAALALLHGVHEEWVPASWRNGSKERYRS